MPYARRWAVPSRGLSRSTNASGSASRSRASPAAVAMVITAFLYAAAGGLVPSGSDVALAPQRLQHRDEHPERGLHLLVGELRPQRRLDPLDDLEDRLLQ